jgi:hypothetical protein
VVGGYYELSGDGMRREKKTVGMILIIIIIIIIVVVVVKEEPRFVTNDCYSLPTLPYLPYPTYATGHLLGKMKESVSTPTHSLNQSVGLCT